MFTGLLSKIRTIQQLIEISIMNDATAKMSFLDLESLSDADKRVLISYFDFEKVTAYLNQGQVSQGSLLSYFD